MGKDFSPLTSKLREIEFERIINEPTRTEKGSKNTI